MINLVAIFVRKHKGIQGIERLVLYRLLKIFPLPFEIRLPLDGLASQLNLSKLQVAGAVNALVKVGFLHEEDDFDRRRGGGRIIKSTDYLEDYVAQLEEGEQAMPNASVATEILDQITQTSRLVVKRGGGKIGILPIKPKGQILLVALIALSDEDGVVASITFSTLIGISGLKRTGVQGVIRKLKSEGVIAFYQPGRLTTIRSESHPEGGTDTSSAVVLKSVGRSGVIYFDLTKLSDSTRFLSAICQSPVEEDLRKLKQLGGIFSIPDLPDEVIGDLAYRCAIDNQLYEEMKRYKGILGQYMEKRLLHHSLTTTVYSSLNSYFSEVSKCPLVLFDKPYVASVGPIGLPYLRAKWELNGFQRPFDRWSHLSVHLLERYTEMIFEVVRMRLGALKREQACMCTEKKRCLSLRVLPLDDSSSDFLLLLRLLKPG